MMFDFTAKLSMDPFHSDSLELTSCIIYPKKAGIK